MPLPIPYNTGFTEEQIAEAFRRAINDMTDEQITALLAEKVDKQEGFSLMSAADHIKLADLQNYDDTELKADVSKTLDKTSINRSTLGYERKNLLKPLAFPETKAGVSITQEDDGKLTFSGTTTSAFTQDLCARTGFESGKELFIRGAEVLENCNYQYCAEDADGTKVYKQIGTAGAVIPADWTLLYVYVQRNTVGSEVQAEIYPLVQYADISDTSYEPYKPSVLEYIAGLEARVAALESSI